MTNSTQSVLLELTQLIISSLNLEIKAEEIDPSAPIYGDGLGLDSIDILEVSLVISKQYGVQIKSDSEENTKIFASLNALAEHIQKNRKQ